MSYDYYDVVGEMLTKGVIRKEEVFDYTIIEDPNLLMEFERNFDFCQVNLAEKCSGFDIQPAKFFFNNDPGFNASARLNKGYFIITIHKDAILQLYTELYTQNNIFKAKSMLLEYKGLGEVADTPLEYLMYNSATMFVYYHELAHLIQYSNMRKLGDSVCNFLDEQYHSGEEPQLSNHHILEYDADSHAANFIFFHTNEYYLRLNVSLKTRENLIRLLSITAAGIFVCYIKFMGALTKELYFKDYKHPHPLIRITYVIANITGAAQGYFADITDIEVLREMLVIAGEYFDGHDEESTVYSFKDAVSTSRVQILEYMDELLNKAENTPSLVMNTVHKNKLLVND